MKFIVPHNLDQYSFVKISCSDKVMLETLSMAGYANYAVSAECVNAYRDGVGSFFEICLKSGAKLIPSAIDDDFKKIQGWSIYCYSCDGGDALEAINELKTLYALREAQRMCDIWRNQSSAPRIHINSLI